MADRHALVRPGIGGVGQFDAGADQLPLSGGGVVEGRLDRAARGPAARRSMAQTRATGKACRLAFSWIMALAGYEPTPAEELPDTRQQPDDDPLITDAQHKMLVPHPT